MIRMGSILLLLSALALAEPFWIKDPTDGGKLTAVVGIAEAHFPEHVQESVALMRAKAEITDMINMKVISEFTDTKKRTGDQVENNVSSSSYLQSSSAIKIEKKEHYKDADGIYYLWVVAN